MSRSGYSEDLDNLDLIRWRGQVASAIRGKRGQRFLGDLLKALDKMPHKALITEDFENADGDVCALGALGKARGMDMEKLDPEDSDAVAAAFDISAQLAREIVYENDEGYFRYDETPEQRYRRMRAWVASLVKRKGA